MTPMHRALKSSAQTRWATPPELFRTLNMEYRFDLDAAAERWNHKVHRYFTPDQDALSRAWEAKTVWLNPPYARQIIGRWLAHAREQVLAAHALTIVCLVPARTDTEWWWKNVIWPVDLSVEVRLIQGRIHFDSPPDGPPPPASATFPSALVIYRLLPELSTMSWRTEYQRGTRTYVNRVGPGFVIPRP